jgi:hypothetical protein
MARCDQVVMGLCLLACATIDLLMLCNNGNGNVNVIVFVYWTGNTTVLSTVSLSNSTKCFAEWTLCCPIDRHSSPSHSDFVRTYIVGTK